MRKFTISNIPKEINNTPYKMSIFDNLDILSTIIEFLPHESKLIIHRVSKSFLQFEKKCNKCNNKICLPVIFQDNVYCYYCTTILLSKSNVDLWHRFDHLSRDNKNRSYLNCSKCKLRCKSSEWYHYHIRFKCSVKNKV